ncbi:MAG: hypothetical protein IT230_05910 [Flavobacteriales bacterium]|nr:hypothetical protein [Flavobacteriales bacterium]
MPLLRIALSDLIGGGRLSPARILVVRTFLMLLVLDPSSTAAQDIGALGQVQPVQFNAGLRAQAGFYNVHGIDPRRRPFFWTISGTPTLSLYGVELPFMVLLSDQQRSFQQPFNQFGLSPRYKWVKLHLGYRDVHFSRFTMAGRRALMAGVELNPGRFRFGFVYGRFAKAVQEDTVAVHDPQAYLSAVPVPSYTRLGYAAKVGVGKENRYIDLIFLRAKDDPGSIPDPKRTMLAPAENMVLGLASKIDLGKQLIWEVDVAGSGYTRDVHAPVMDEPPQVANLLGNFFIPRSSSAWLTAVETSLGLKRRRARYKLTYRQVDPGFESMGAYYFQSDVRQLTATAATTLAKNKVSLNLTGGWQRDNLRKQRTSTAQRLIGNISVNYTSGKAFGMLANFSNFGITQQPVRASSQDTAMLRQVSRNLLLQPRLHYVRGNGSHTGTLTANQFALNDLTTGITNTAQLSGLHLEVNYTRGWKQHGTSAGGGPIYRKVDTNAGHTQSTGLQVNAGRQWLKEKLRTGLRSTFLANVLPDGSTGSTWQLGLDGAYTVSKRIALTLQLTHQNNASPDPLLPAFAEDTGVLGIDIRF